jgi:hypothetical protein
MSQELIVIDDFHPFPNELREHALNQYYIDWMGHDGQIYKRVCLTEVPALCSMLEELLGPIDMLGMGYRLNFNEEEPNAAIHSDLGWGTHALVLYLCEGPGGTAFWRHKETNMPAIDPGDTWLFEQVNGDWDDESKWQQERMVELKFNRALIYESRLFHSRYPFKAFGHDGTTGRLIAVAFFTPRNSHDSPSDSA